MNGTRQTEPAPRVSVFPLLLIGASLLLNVYLASRLLDRKNGTTITVEVADNLKTAEASQTSAAAPTTTATSEFAESKVTSFHWSEIESTDYRQYIANLRSVGVPEQVIRDIIVTDLNQIYTKRARDIWPQRETQYWQKYANERETPKQTDQLAALGQEQSAILQELLGVRISRQELIDTVYLQVQGSERQLLFLPPERRQAALRALADADFESKEMKLHSQGGYRTVDEQKLFNEKLAALSEVLQPEELDEFHRRNSPVGMQLKQEVRYLNLTPEEYVEVLRAKESGGGEQHTKDIVQKLFGDERAKEFERVSSAFYINARTGAEAEGIPLDRVDQAANFADDSVKKGFAAAQDKTLSVEERKARLNELQTQAEIQIKDLLGDKASQTMLRDLRNVLRSSASSLKP